MSAPTKEQLAAQKAAEEEKAKAEAAAAKERAKPIPPRPAGAPNLGDKDPAVIAWDAEYGSR